MARRKKEETKGAAAWITTFSDLMNLLLCFFIMLFAMSTIDQEKFQELIVSFSSGFGIFTTSSAAIGDGGVVSSGLESLNEIGQELSNMGLNFEGSSAEISPAVEDFKKLELQEMIAQSEAMQDDIEGQLQELNIIGELDVEATAQYVQLTLSGSMLFESGSAEIKPDAVSLVDKLGGILSPYQGNNIEVIGHTDNVPMTGGTKYEDNIDLSMARAKTIALYMIENNNLNIEDILFSGKGEYDPLVSNSTAEGRAQNRRVEIRIYNDLSTEKSGV